MGLYEDRRAELASVEVHFEGFHEFHLVFLYQNSTAVHFLLVFLHSCYLETHLLQLLTQNVVVFRAQVYFLQAEDVRVYVLYLLKYFWLSVSIFQVFFRNIWVFPMITININLRENIVAHDP